MLIVPRINVRDAPYNAKGDGVTDDTAAIVAALAATPTGAACFFPRGVYLLDADAIVNYTARWIVGELIAAQDNSATTIRARTEGTALFHAINSFGVANIRFDADDKADHALSIENGISTILTNCIFEGGLDAGLLAEDLSGAATVARDIDSSAATQRL
jgi:hypothetical protein